MDKKVLAVLLAVLLVLAVASIFVIQYASAASGKILAGIFLLIAAGILLAVNRKR